MAERPLRVIGESRLLLVEGDDDVNLVTALFMRRGVTGVQVEPTRGKDGLRDDLLAWTLNDDFGQVEWLGILQDGDDDPAGRFVSICGHLRSRGLAVPIVPWQSAGSGPRTMAAVVEAEGYGNDLEGLTIRALAESRDVATPCVSALLRCVEDAGKPLPRQVSKAHMRAWLATVDPPTLPLARAAQRGLLPLDHPVFDQLASILTL